MIISLTNQKKVRENSKVLQHDLVKQVFVRYPGSALMNGSNKGPFDNHTTPGTNLNPKMALELILGLMQLPQWHQTLPGRTPVLKHS